MSSTQHRIRPARPDWPTSSVRACDIDLGAHCAQYAGGHWINVSTHDCIIMAALRHAIRVGAYRYQIVERKAL